MKIVKYPLTVLSFFLSTISVVNIVYEILPPFIVLIMLLLAAVLATRDNQVYTSKINLSAAIIANILFGINIDISHHDFYFIYTISSIFISITIGLRLFFIRFFSYARYFYIEIIGAVVATLLFVLGLYIKPLGWLEIFLASVPMLFSWSQAHFIYYNQKIFKEKPESQISDGIQGVEAPLFELSDHNGELVRLEDFKGKRHVLLIFVRGDWCPYCHMMLRTYMKNKEKLATKNIMLLAISPDSTETNLNMVKKLDLEYRVLADAKMKIAKEYGVNLLGYKYSNIPDHEEGMPLPASFLVDKNGLIQYTSHSRKVGEFLDPSLIFPIIEKL